MKTSPPLIAILLFAAVLLAACGTPAAAAPIVPKGSVPAGTQPGQLTGLAPCEYQPEGGKVKYPAECGTLTVSENWDKAGSRRIALPVVRIPAGGPNPTEPVFWLVGGPGGTNMSWAPPAWLLARHDVLLVGYRGVDGSVVLACPALSSALRAHTGRDLASEAARAEYQAAARQCAQDLEAAGVDLTGYTMPNVIKDMEAVRAALGYGKID